MRIDSTMVGKSLNDLPVAPGPPRKSVSPLKQHPQRGCVEAAGARRVPRRVQHGQLDVPHGEHLAVGELAAGGSGWVWSHSTRSSGWR